jgi:hypothetical protein
MSTKHIYNMATIKLTNVYIVDLIKILVIENNGIMCVVKELHLVTSVKNPNGFCF